MNPKRRSTRGSDRTGGVWKGFARRVALAMLTAVSATPLVAQTTVIRLTPDPSVTAASSRPEEAIPAGQLVPFLKGQGDWIYNVSEPTLTVFRPDPARANGTAVIMAPGGGFHFLTWGNEAEPIARWLAERGVTAFLLKYRTLPNTREELTALTRMEPRAVVARVQEEFPAVRPLAVADGRAAVQYVREHAAEYGVAPNRVGMMGGSAGAVLALAVVLDPRDDAKPDFLALLYGGVFDDLRPLRVPASAPPAFIVFASDDEMGFAPTNVEIYNGWLAAGRPVEMHGYAEGGHGFALSHHDLPVGTWPARFEDWLRAQRLLTPP